MKDKICPMTFSTTMGFEGFSNCIESGCAWWTSMYSSEAVLQYGCAIEFIALKNSKGEIVV